MLITNNQRPGVYSQYDVSSLYAASSSSKYAAVVAKAAGGEPDTPQAFTSYSKAREVYGPEDRLMLGAISILLGSGVSRVIAVPVTGDDYSPALAAAASLEDVGALVCDAEEASDIKKVLAAVEAASGALREQIGYCGVGGGAAALAAAGALNSERMVICCPASLPLGDTGAPSPFFTAAAVAGAVLAADDPVHNFSGLGITCLEPPARLAEEQVQELLAGGVTVVEPVGEGVQIVRALTTKAGTDKAMGSLNTILIIDDVMTDTRATLRQRLRGSRITAHSRDSILAQVMVVLAGKQDDGIIESFLAPKVYTHEEDPAICVVELSFQAAHVLSQIHLVAHIQV